MRRVSVIFGVSCTTALLVMTAPAAGVDSRPMVETLVPTPRAAAPTPAAPEVLGTLEVPRLGLTAVVRSGVDARTLQNAIGHVPETPRPGDRGNAALAALRDPYFGPLRAIRRGDRLRMRTRNDVREY